MSEDKLKQSANDLVAYLQELYKDWEGVVQFGDTPRRLTSMYQEFCWSPEKIETELKKTFRSFENGYDEMLVTRPIDVHTLCPHHLLPCFFKVTIGYVPGGKVLGLSKFIRISTVLAKRPIMQEEYTRVLADELEKRLDPKGVAVQVVGSHGCMTSRGVQQHSEVTTSVIRGAFRDEPVTRAEFMAICNRA